MKKIFLDRRVVVAAFALALLSVYVEFWLPTHPVTAKKQFDLARDYAQVGRKEEAAELYKQAAKSGMADAQYWLGTVYGTGDGIEMNKAEAFNWLLKAANQGFPPAETEVGVAYWGGDGVRQNSAEALRWYTKAATDGEINAQYSLGECFQSGNCLNLKKDTAEATAWYQKAAQGGSFIARVKLAGYSSIEAYNEHQDEIMGEDISFAKLYARSYGPPGLQIGKRYNVQAQVNGDLTILEAPGSYSGQDINTVRDFDDSNQMESVLSKAGTEHNMVCNLVVSMSSGESKGHGQLKIRRAEDCY